MAFLCNSSLSTPKITNTAFLFPRLSQHAQSILSVPCQRKPPIFSSCRPVYASVSGGQKPEVVVTDPTSSGETNRSSSSMKLTYLEVSSFISTFSDHYCNSFPVYFGENWSRGTVGCWLWMASTFLWIQYWLETWILGLRGYSTVPKKL